MEILRGKKTFAAILLFCVCVFSQDFSLDLQSVQKTRQETQSKPDWAASGLNLLVPGMGYFYLGEKRSAVSFLSTDIFLWGSFFFTYQTSKRRHESSLGFARIYAHTRSTRPYTDMYWSYLSNKSFMKVEDFNWAMRNNRDFDLQYTDASDFWSWDSEEHRDRYADMRKTAESWRTASTLVLGTLALNRIVSFVTARVATKKYNDAKISAPQIIPTLGQESKTVGVALMFGI